MRRWLILPLLVGALLSTGSARSTKGIPTAYPIPPGAAALGYRRNIYYFTPRVADIAFSAVTNSKFYNGSPGFLSITPPSGAYTTAANGQLQMIYPSGGPANHAGLVATMNALNSQSVAGNQGFLPYLSASQGFCIEEAVTHSVSDPDNWDALFLYPQEHNTLQNDHLNTDPTGYERWLELDVNENGLGTNQGGAYRGAVISWEGFASGALTFTVAPSGTSGTLTANWLGSTRSDWTIKFSDAQTHAATLTKNSTAVTWTGAITGSPTTAATVGYARSLTSNTQTAALDYTVEHIFTGCLDPVGQTWAIWQDGTLQNTLAIPASDLIVYTWHYFPILYMQSRGANVGHTQNVRYIAAWGP